jgi:YD repeat-containing protein
MTVASNVLGGCASFQYDADGRVTNSTDERGSAQSLAYDANGNLTKQVDELGRTTTYGYDLLDRLVVFSNRIGGVTTYRYDSMGRLDSITTAAGLTESYRYDGLGRVTNISQGGLSWAVGYNREGVAVSWRSPMGHTMRMGVNPLGFLTNHVDAAGAQTVFEHDAMGRVTR